ncbi:HlyD family efflux transporter periplasmic adaptor subunit [Guyparkeria halophila]|uniref:HlyD family efflux transporter periplasmic adaptor subunit n=1 Tax=Guyparkeria halophila TaxID=47960 RepID=A0A6I6CUY4_9GAMM|nr:MULTISPECIES: HlyD family efflux transporter periplasmic adaptor subunit [Guyparkeria]QGT77859.1 HlyD family efflux transporter periplasmic adaptor subunit [Guyparkeria halophila]TKA89299.1 HlyD family efflux transporter periplasmic adaptor subunit [Guyparkeria sp. SB14A]
MRRIESSWARRLIGPVALLGAGLATPAWAVEVEGRLGFADRVALSTPVAGVVESVPVRAGQRVEAGALLLALDSTPFDQRHRMAAAQIEGLRLAADEAALDAERVQALYDRTVGSDSERALAVIAREQAEGERDRVRAQAALRAWERDQARLEAPFDAQVLSVNTAVGEVVSPQLTPPTLVEIARADELLAVARVDADQLGALELGDEIAVDRNGDRQSGTVDAIRARTDGDGPVRYELAVRVPRGDGWRAGQSVTLDLPGD